MIDLAAHPTDASIVWAVTSDGVTPDRIERSDDGGRAFVTIAEPAPGALLERIAIAPSDPARLYVGAYVLPAGDGVRRGLLLRSEDAAARFEATEIELASEERAPIPLGVDPTDPGRVFVRVARSEYDPRPERLLVSADGGRTFAQVFALGRMEAFAIAEDGRTVLVGSAEEGGLWAARDGGTDFEQISTLATRCLEVRGGALWMCTVETRSGFTFARASLDASEVEPLLVMAELAEQVACGACTDSRRTCPAWLDDLRADSLAYYGRSAVPAGDIDASPTCDADGGTSTPRDAGLAEPPPASCAASPWANEPAKGALVFVAVLVWSVTRRIRGEA